MKLGFLIFALSYVTGSVDAVEEPGSSPPQLFQSVQILHQISKLGLSSLEEPFRAYYSDGAKIRAEQVQSSLEEMKRFYEARLGIQHVNIALAVLNSNQWVTFSSYPYGLPYCAGDDPSVIFVPATPDNWSAGIIRAQAERISAEACAAFFRSNHTSFEALVDNLVDGIAFHELGHVL